MSVAYLTGWDGALVQRTHFGSEKEWRQRFGHWDPVSQPGQSSWPATGWGEPIATVDVADKISIFYPSPNGLIREVAQAKDGAVYSPGEWA